MRRRSMFGLRTAMACLAVTGAGLAAGRARAAAITSIYDLWAAGSGTTIGSDSFLATPWIAKGALPAGSILRSVSINARLETSGGVDTWASDLCVYVDPSPPPPSDPALLQVGGYETLGNPATKLDWANGQSGNIGDTVIDTKTAPADFPDSIDLNTAGLYLGCGGWAEATWTGTVTVTYDAPVATWTGAGGAIWSTAGSWDPTTVPGAGETVLFGAAGSIGAVTLDSARTVDRHRPAGLPPAAIGLVGGVAVAAASAGRTCK